MKKLGFQLAALALVATSAAPALAQSIDEALGLYKRKSYEEAAFAFYDVVANDPSADNRDQAQIYLAETLKKLDLLVPALFYYKDIFQNGGRGNRYYLNAVEGLLAVQEALHDPIFVPSLLDNGYDPDGFANLNPAQIAQINYLIGELELRKNILEDAKNFLEYVPPESPSHPKARYLLGVIAVRKNKPEDAMQHFKAILDLIEADTGSPDLQALRNLALIAAGRVAYGLGRFGEADSYYAQVPRYSDEWFNAMYEDAWAHFRAAGTGSPEDQAREYGKALGDLQSVTAPFFAKRHVPEAYVIQGTTYFVNCQWDRVRRAVDRYKKVYEPMGAGLKSYLEGTRPASEYYRDVVAGGNGRFSIEVAREVRRFKRFLDYNYMIDHMAWERARIDEVKLWRGGALVQTMTEVIDGERAQLENVVGGWVKRRLRFLHDQLANFQSQINILDFEVTDAERQWLEQGKEILKGRRARLPRPEIPNDQWQHWSFDREFWKDEAGYFQHSLRSECF